MSRELRELKSIGEVNFSKLYSEQENGEPIVPAIIVIEDKLVSDGLFAFCMQGFMNRLSLEKTIEIGKVTFYSRKSRKLWTKGETSGDFLNFSKIYIDCDYDSLMITAIPDGPTCHNGVDSCFEEPDIGE